MTAKDFIDILCSIDYHNVFVRGVSDLSKRITIKDIADRAGVSIGSVHCAIAGKPGVGEETRKRILEIATQMGYRPNTAAAALKRKSVRIAAVFPGPTEENRFFYTAVWEGIRDYFSSLTDLKVELLEVPYYTGIDNPSEDLRWLADQPQIDGILIVGYLCQQARTALNVLVQRGTPVVLVGSDIPQQERLCCVQPNYDVVGRMMMEQLTGRIPSNGNILVCIGDTLNPPHYETVQGMDAYLQENKCESQLHKVPTNNGGNDEYQRILYTFRNTPGISACCSVNARGSVLLSQALRELSLEQRVIAIGSDLFDENISALHEGIFINLLHKNPYTQSFLASRYITDYLLRDIRPSQEKKYIGSELVFRSSLPMYEIGSYRLVL